MRSIILTGAGGRLGTLHARAIKKADPSIHLIGIDAHPFRIQRAVTDEAFLVPRSSEPTYIPTVQKIIEKTGVAFEMKLPHESFNRKIGVFAEKLFDPEGNLVSGAEYDAGMKEWLPTHADGDFIQSLMKPVTEPGKYASWIAAPKVGIDNKPGDFEYVKLHMA